MAPPKLKLLQTSQISPPPNSLPETTLPLTFFDVVWLASGTVDRIFFYSFPHSTDHFIHNTLPNFKSSLSTTLQRFFPLAGKIRPTPGTEDRYEIRYADGDSVALTVAEHVEPEDFNELSKSHPRGIDRLLVLQPELKQSGDTWPVLAIQVTVFPGHGLTVAVSVVHAACDGSSSTRFVSAWASACRTAEFELVPSPVFDRTHVSDPGGLYKVFLGCAKAILFSVQQSSSNENTAPTPTPTQLVSATFILTSKHIEKLKKRATTKAINDGDALFRCSTIVATYAYAWTCFVKARRYLEERIAHMAFAADCRSLHRPPLPSTYFGNCLSCCFVEGIKTAELVRDDGFETAAKAIARAIKEFKDEPLKDGEKILENFTQLQEPLTVAGSPKFGVYGVDFGWGRPLKVELTSVMRTGAMALAESRDDEGGVEIGLVLAKDEIDEFAAQFNGGLKSFIDCEG